MENRRETYATLKSDPERGWVRCRHFHYFGKRQKRQNLRLKNAVCYDSNTCKDGCEWGKKKELETEEDGRKK
jgi:hypothetical protein